MKENLKNGLIATGIIVIMGIILYVIFSENDEKEEVELSVDLNSEIASEDPRESAANFIKSAGTIGDYEGLTDEQVSKGEMKSSSEMREEALDRVEDVIIPDGPLLSGRERDFIREDNSQFPVFYQVEDVKVGEPYEESTITVNHDGVGAVEYDSIKVDVDFKSIETLFSWPTDASFTPIVSEEMSYDEHENVVVHLAKSGDLWFIYDVEDSEYELNARLATWSGKGQYSFPYEKKLVKEYPIENIHGSAEQEEMNND